MLLMTGETIPIRLFLGGFDLTPTFREVNKKYSTRYYLSLVLIDEGMSGNKSLICPTRLHSTAPRSFITGIHRSDVLREIAILPMKLFHDYSTWKLLHEKTAPKLTTF